MPFTFAHPFYIAPVKCIKPRYLSLTGLILGSMSPDFEYFIALEPYQRIGHTPWGLLLTAIPLSIVIMLLLQVIMRPFALHLPSRYDLDARAYGLWRSFDHRRLGSWIVFLLSVVIGFYSHVAIDAFTHASGYAVMRLMVLQHIYFGLPVFKILQHSLSVFGLAAELLILWRVLAKASLSDPSFPRATARRKWMYWSSVLATSAVTTLLKLVLTSSANKLGILVVAPISGMLPGIAAAGLIFRRGS